MSIEKVKVEIGSRWRPGHRVFRDDDAGDYFEVNSRMLKASEHLIQLALLAPKPKAGFMKLRDICVCPKTGR